MKNNLKTRKMSYAGHIMWKNHHSLNSSGCSRHLGSRNMFGFLSSNSIMLFFLSIPFFLLFTCPSHTAAFSLWSYLPLVPPQQVSQYIIVTYYCGQSLDSKYPCRRCFWGFGSNWTGNPIWVPICVCTVRLCVANDVSRGDVVRTMGWNRPVPEGRLFDDLISCDAWRRSHADARSSGRRPRHARVSGSILTKLRQLRFSGGLRQSNATITSFEGLVG